MTLTIELTKEQEAALKQIAARKGVSVETLAAAAVRQTIAATSTTVDDLIKDIVRENRELYKRLA